MNWMSDSPSTLLWMTLALPLAVAVLLPLFHRKPDVREAVSLLGGMLLAATNLSLLDHFHAGARPQVTLVQLLPELSLSLKLEPLGMLFGLIASLLWVVTTIYAIGYMRGNKEQHQTRFFMCFAVAITCAMGIAYAEDLFTTFVFYEGMTLGTVALVTHAGTQNARMAGRTYLGVLMGTSLGLLLPAIIWVWYHAGTLDYQYGGIIRNICGWPLGLMLLLFAYGTAKAALMPVHRWLPAAMVAPTPVSALLHAVAVVKAGVFIIVKVLVYIFGVDYMAMITESHWIAGSWLAWLAGLTILISSLIALQQDNLKKRLAYSTISQLSYVVMAAAIFTDYALVGAITHIAAHALGKITLFFGAGAIYTASGKKNVSELDGIGKMMPVTMIAFSIGILVMIGLPPTVGFLSKWYMLKGAFLAEHYVAFGVFIASTLLNGAYFLPIIYQAFFLDPPARKKRHGEAPRSILIAISITATACIGFFLFPESIEDIIFTLIPKDLLHY